VSRWAELVGKGVDRLLDMPPARATFTVERDVAVPMPDGVALVGDRYRPDGVHGRQGPMPVVLIRLPYGRAGLNGQVYGGALARQGFQVFIQATRGTFGSGGQFRPFLHEHEDGLATLDWLRRQPWCDGRVAMTGGSYFGHTQWAVAPYADPPLVCVSPHVTASNITASFYDHGAPLLDNALSWSAQIGRQEAHGSLFGLLATPARIARVRRTARRRPLQNADVAVTGAPVAFWRDFVEHATPGDRFWSGADHSGADLTRMPPVNMGTGWWDLFLAWQLDDFTALQDAGVPARLVVGPWRHGEPGELKEILAGDLRWLDHHLNGAPAPQGPPVRVFLQQADTWLEFDRWPPPGTVTTTVHLAAGGVLIEASPSADSAASTSFTYDPADPTPGVGGPLLVPPGKQADNRSVEARPDVIVFTGPRLTADLDLVGPVRARIHVRTELPHADVFVRLCDVDQQGVSRNVVDGIRRLDPRTVPAPDVHVGDDGVLAVDVQLFPTAYRVKAGHRLRVQVAGGAFPRFAANLGTDEPFATATAGRRNRFEVFHDAVHPSNVALPTRL
jgi:putative CocE/NonD family hydrolase